MSDCLFCDIVARTIPATIVDDDGEVLAIRDVNPQAPTHVLVLPHRHIVSANDLTRADDALWGRMLEVAQHVAAGDGIAEDGYRLVINIGSNGGQTVGHLHVHVLGGRLMTWPPG
jgi:histidine triad (HIT) family protein